MAQFDKFFVLYEPTERPPVKTKGYEEVQNFYNHRKPEIEQPEIEQSDIVQNPYLEQVIPVVEPGTLKREEPEVKQSKVKQPDVVQFFMDRGLTENQSKGIYGNLMQESQLNTRAVSRDGHNSYGIAQWTNDRKDRLFQMYGENPTLQQQLEYLWWELNNTEKSALNSLLQTDTIEDATRVFMQKFERPHKDYARLDKRIQYATNI